MSLLASASVVEPGAGGLRGGARRPRAVCTSGRAFPWD